MKLEELEQTNKISKFVKSCLLNEFHGKDVYLELWQKANNIKEFKELIIKDNRVSLEQGTAELMKEDGDNNLLYLNYILKNKFFETDSDSGSLKIGSNNFEILIPNGYGDGITKVAILEENELPHVQSSFTFFSIINGTFNIYDYDCGDNIIKTVSGKFLVYYGFGFVIFLKCNY